MPVGLRTPECNTLLFVILQTVCPGVVIIARKWIVVAALFGATGVLMGTFGAHVLPEMLATRELTDGQIAKQAAAFDTAVRYQLYHTPVMLTVGILSGLGFGRWLQAAGVAFATGTLVFSGCLYVFVLTGFHQLAMVVPLGGVALIVGWILLGTAALVPVGADRGDVSDG